MQHLCNFVENTKAICYNTWSDYIRCSNEPSYVNRHFICFKLIPDAVKGEYFSDYILIKGKKLGEYCKKIGEVVVAEELVIVVGKVAMDIARKMRYL